MSKPSKNPLSLFFHTFPLFFNLYQVFEGIPTLIWHLGRITIKKFKYPCIQTPQLLKAGGSGGVDTYT